MNFIYNVHEHHLHFVITTTHGQSLGWDPPKSNASRNLGALDKKYFTLVFKYNQQRR